MVPAAVLTQSKPDPITAVRPVSTVVLKISVTRPKQAKPMVTKPNLPTRMHTNQSPSSKVSTSSSRVTAVKALVVNAAQGMQGKWEWRPKCPILDHVSHNTSASITLKRFDYNDVRGRSKSGVIDSGCSRHMIRNMSYLSDFEELNGGYVAFDGNPKGGKISRKGKIRTGKLDFDDVYFVKELSGLENQLSLKVKVIISDNGTEFKNNDLNQFCGMKAIKREFSVPRTPQQNGIVERKNRTLIGAAKTMLADSLLPIPFWAKAVNTACYVQNRVLVTKPHNKTPYDLLHENKPNVAGSGPTWLFDIDTLTKTINYQPVTVGNQTNPSTGFQDKFDVEKAREESDQQYVLFPVCSAQSKKQDDKTKREAKGKSPVESITGFRNLSAKFEDFSDSSINEVNAAGNLVPTVGQIFSNNTNTFSAAGPSNAASPTHEKSSCIDASQLLDDFYMPELEEITYSDDEDNVGVRITSII
nr:putative ribonuclease H-like domain-containing protein [Tanacetum cinerariifolium]